MTTQKVRQLIAEVLNDVADALSVDAPTAKIKVGITLLGSEHGTSEVLAGVALARSSLPDSDIVVIDGTSPDECHAKMERLLESGEISSAVTMHYNFPIGTSTIGLVTTPARGKKIFLASTTGTSAIDRVESMVRNTIYGIATAKAYGISNPTVGILNVDGSRQTERILNELISRGYAVTLAVSQRTDGGVVMRGNDLLTGVPDIMVCDSLTGNLLMKVFSAYTTGGSYESVGFGYGPGVGEGNDKIINIISRASGAPVIAGALEYAAAMARGKLTEVAAREIALASNAGLMELTKPKKQATVNAVKEPAKKTVTEQIAGIDVLELEDAQLLLWKNSIYAETGMGCTGPIILVSPEDYQEAIAILKAMK